MPSRRTFLVQSSLTAAGLALVPRAVLARQAPAATRTETLRRNVGVFIGRGGTIGWLATPDAAVVVDTQFPDTAKACLEAVTAKGRRQVDLLLNTHHHGDHTGGNGVFRPVTTRIVAHARVPALQKQAAAQQPQGGGDVVVADTTFEQTWKADVGDEVVQAVHYGPAHTGGDAVITFQKAQVTHMGDLMFRERHPFIDRPAGASIRNWITTLERVVGDVPRDTIYIFGHAKADVPVTGSATEVRAFRDYLSAVLEFTTKAMKAGQSRDAITATKALPGFEDYQEAPPRLTLASVLGVAYDELSQAAG
jgi:cyclase